MGFSALPPVPAAENKEWLYRFNNAVKQNIELLTGQRGQSSSRAILTGQLKLDAVPELKMRQVTATGAGIAVNSGTSTVVVTQADYAKNATQSFTSYSNTTGSQTKSYSFAKNQTSSAASGTT